MGSSLYAQNSKPQASFLSESHGCYTAVISVHYKMNKMASITENQNINKILKPANFLSKTYQQAVVFSNMFNISFLFLQYFSINEKKVSLLFKVSVIVICKKFSFSVAQKTA